MRKILIVLLVAVAAMAGYDSAPAYYVKKGDFRCPACNGRTIQNRDHKHFCVEEDCGKSWLPWVEGDK